MTPAAVFLPVMARTEGLGSSVLSRVSPAVLRHHSPVIESPCPLDNIALLTAWSRHPTKGAG